jgi:hypothetical protein
LLARLGQLRWVSALRRRRALRLCVVASAVIALALVLSISVTLPLLALSPVLFGVPHIASDVRYLLVRAARGQSGVLVPLQLARVLGPLFALAALLGLFGAGSAAFAVACAALAWTALATAQSARLRIVLSTAALAASALALSYPWLARLMLAQAHNWIALGIAAFLVRRRAAAGWLPLVLIVVGVLLIASGACDTWLVLASSGSVGRTALGEVAAVVAPPGTAPVVVLRWVALFAFAQAVHYSAWLSIVPDAERESERPVSFRRSFELLRADFGELGARGVVLATIALPVSACFALDAARRAYVGMAIFHGFVELAWLLVLLSSTRFGAASRRVVA